MVPLFLLLLLASLAALSVSRPGSVYGLEPDQAADETRYFVQVLQLTEKKNWKNARQRRHRAFVRNRYLRRPGHVLRNKWQEDLDIYFVLCRR